MVPGLSVEVIGIIVTDLAMTRSERLPQLFFQK